MQALEVADFATDSLDAPFDDFGNVLARLGIVVEGIKHGPNEPERETLGLGGEDQMKPVEVPLFVLPVARFRCLGLWHQPLPLVEAHGADADSSLFRQFSNLHAFSVKCKRWLRVKVFFGIEVAA